MLSDAQGSGKVLLSGASGMLGVAIGNALQHRGTGVLQLVRRPATAPREITWDPHIGGGIAEVERLEGLTAAMHLSGANLADRRWTKAYKEEMRASRVDSTRVLSEALARLKRGPTVLIAASAMGFYGNRGDEVLDEDSKVGAGFFPELCAAWEAATKPAEEAGIRVVHLRLGIVLGSHGGLMAKLGPMFRLGLGGPLGNGRQWASWISERDAVAAALFAMESKDLAGSVNAVAPVAVTNAEFTREFGHAVHRPALVPAPAFALRLAFGEMADDALLASTRVVPKRLLEAGFQFAHPTLREAFAAALAAS